MKDAHLSENTQSSPDHGGVASTPECRARGSMMRPERMPLYVTLIYLAVAAAWIFFSDLALEGRLNDLNSIARAQTLKGWFFVIVSGSALYVTLRSYHGRSAEHLAKLAEMTKALTHTENEIRRMNADLEQRVEQRTRQLEAANRELEAFVHAVSHDLRAPLRSMAGFSQALRTLTPAGLDAQAVHYLERIHDASRRMSGLIDALLDLSRISQSQMHPRRVDFTQLVLDSMESMRERYPARQIKVYVQPGMSAQADPRLLRIAVDNLLDNAWKYTALNPTAEVSVRSSVQDGEMCYSVQDDGVGFNMAYADKLFGPFQRLHHQSQFPGTGIGLVTVQRILARHGGRIWAHAEVNRGATFTFTLPDGKD